MRVPDSRGPAALAPPAAAQPTRPQPPHPGALLHPSRHPGPLRPAEVLALQRKVGNRALGRLLRAAPPLAGRVTGAAPGPGGAATLQRKLGLELEFAVPIDKAGDLSEDDHKVLRGERNDPTRLKEIRSAADAGYGEFREIDLLGLAADHSSRVLPARSTYPIRVLGRSILEMTFNPAVETAEELEKTLEAVDSTIAAIDQRTGGLKKRAKLASGIHVGPVDGDTKPPELSWDASIHVNVGIDPRRLHGLLKWYGESPYAPASAHRNVPMKTALDVTEDVIRVFRDASQADLSDVQHWNGLRGLTMMYVMYLLSGADSSPLRSSVKNFATILTKTPFTDLVSHGMTPAERDWLGGAWTTYRKVLLEMTRPGEDESSPLIRRTKVNDPSALKDPSWNIGSLFKKGPPVLISQGKEIAADEVGPERSKADRVTEGGRRKGMVLEFRSLPGPFSASQWKQVARDFLAQADEQNAVKDYAEPPPKVQKPSSREEEVPSKLKERSETIRTLELPSIPTVSSTTVSSSTGGGTSTSGGSVSSGERRRPLPPPPRNSQGRATTLPTETEARTTTSTVGTSVRSPQQGSTITVEQKDSYWTTGAVVSWNNATYRVVQKIGLWKYELAPV